MARTVLRYEAGRAIWSPNEPDCRGRVSSGPIGATAAGAFPVTYIASGVERPASHHPTAPKRTYSRLRGQAMLERGRHDR